MKILRDLFAFFCGCIAGITPNEKSNIHPLLLGVLFALLFTKIVFGDDDAGYQWSLSDLYFFLIVGGEGALGAFVTSKTFAH